MITIRKDTEFRFTQQGSEQGIEIHFGKGLEFWSCRRGTDLTDFDDLLEYHLPHIDLEKITYSIARNLEKKLYRKLSGCKQQRTMKKAFFDFLNHVEKQYCKRPTANSKPSKSLIQNINELQLDTNIIRSMSVYALLSPELTRCFGNRRSPYSSLFLQIK